MPIFEREQRYIVFKISDLSIEQRRSIEFFRDKPLNPVRTRECVVVEADWPIYDRVWGMVEDQWVSEITTYGEDKMKNPIHPAPVEFTAAQLSVDPILRYFHYAHLPESLAGVSRPFCELAEAVVNTLPRNAERSVALRKLLEAKDAAVRANVPEETERTTARQDETAREFGEPVITGPDTSEEPLKP